MDPISSSGSSIPTSLVALSQPIISHIISYLEAPHLPLRLINKEWSTAIEFHHSLSLCTDSNCTGKCNEFDKFIEARQALPFIPSWCVDVSTSDLEMFDVAFPHSIEEEKEMGLLPLTALDFPFTEFSSGAMTRLLSNPTMASVTRLAILIDCDKSAHQDEIPGIMDRSPCLKNLRELFIQGMDDTRGDAFVSKLAHLPILSQLNTLSFGAFQISSKGLNKLSLSPFVTGLTSLSISCNDVHGVLDSNSIFSSSRSLTSLKSLDFSCTRISLASLAHLGQSPNMSRVTSLRLTDSFRSEREEEMARVIIQQSPAFSNLKHLYM